MRKEEQNGTKKQDRAFLFFSQTFQILQPLEKLPPYGRLFSSSCGGLQPLAANDGALRAPPFENFF